MGRRVDFINLCEFLKKMLLTSSIQESKGAAGSFRSC